MKNLEKIADTVSEEGAVAEMEASVPLATVEGKEAVENGVIEPTETTINESGNLIVASSEIATGNIEDASSGMDSKNSEINGIKENTLDENGKECNGELLNGDDKLVVTSSDQSVQMINGNSKKEEKEKEEEEVERRQFEETAVDMCNGEVKESAQKQSINSSPKVDERNQEENLTINNEKEETFKIPNTIEELLEDEVPKEDSSLVKEHKNDAVTIEINKEITDKSSDMETDNNDSSDFANEKEGKLEEIKSDESLTLSDEAPMEIDAEKLVSEEAVKESADAVVNPFVDETSPDPDENGMKEVEKKEESPDSKENASQISLESVDQGGSEDENSDDDLDINAGLDKCFSALEKEISKDEALDLPRSSDVKKEQENSVKAIVDIDDSSRDVSNVPSEAEEGGNEADDEGERTSEPVVSEEPDQDLDQALGELEMIEKTTKRILDDESESLKRPHEEPSEPVSKKVKVDESLEEAVEVVKNKKIKKVLKKMTRNDLEDLIANKMVEVMTNKSEIGKLRHQCDSFQESVEKWKRRAQALSKQCTDLSTVMRKYITDSKSRPRDKVAPVRITRSVGLQVMTPDQRRLQQQRNMNRGRVQEKAVAPGAVQKPPPPKPTLSNGAVKTSGPIATPSSQLPRTVGGTTISPAKSTPAQIRNTGSVTITQTKTPTPNSAPKPVIDVVDLSDDESTPAPPPPKPTPPPARQTPTSMVRSSGPRQQGQQFIMQGNQLYPVRQQQAMARQNLQANRPMLGSRPRAPIKAVHPAPLPPMPNPQPNSPNWKLLPPRPALKISKVNNGIVLSWNMNLNLATHATIASYQLYAYQESAMQRPDPSLWKKVGDVKALPLPMACTLTQFTRGNKYHFAVRAMDGHSRVGQFSDPNSIVLN